MIILMDPSEDWGVKLVIVWLVSGRIDSPIVRQEETVSLSRFFFLLSDKYCKSFRIMCPIFYSNYVLFLFPFPLRLRNFGALSSFTAANLERSPQRWRYSRHRMYVSTERCERYYGPTKWEAMRFSRGCTSGSGSWNFWNM